MAAIHNLDEGISWKKLQKILQKVQKAINSNRPVKGDGITIHETDTGSIISVGSKTSDDTNASADISAGQWITVDVMDKNCKRSTIQVWGIPGSQ